MRAAMIALAGLCWAGSARAESGFYVLVAMLSDPNQAAAIHRRVRACGLSTTADRSDRFQGFPRGAYAVVLGPYRSARRAEAVRRAAAPCAPGASVQFGRYAVPGE